MSISSEMKTCVEKYCLQYSSLAKKEDKDYYTFSCNKIVDIIGSLPESDDESKMLLLVTQCINFINQTFERLLPDYQYYSHFGYGNCYLAKNEKCSNLISKG